MPGIDRILCADWGKERDKRAVYEVLVTDRLVRRVRANVGEVRSLIAYASQLDASTLVTFDAPIGVPVSFIHAVRSAQPGSSIDGFLDWIFSATLDPCSIAENWSVEAPFFAVPSGKGSLGRFTEAARLCGVELRRTIEDTEKAIRRELAKGTGIRAVARKVGVGVGTVQRVKAEQAA